MSKNTNEDKNNHQEGHIKAETEILFECRSGLPCFTKCCRDVNIFLTPYDVLRMKNSLGITSTEFLRLYTRTLIPQSTGLPVIQLKMDEAADKKCPFVDEGGCRIYEDRPWACRMYPLDKTEGGDGFVFVVSAEICRGQNATKPWKVEDWLSDQGLAPYDDMDVMFQKMTLNKRLLEEGVTNPRLQEMYRMACYDLDTFRRFVFETRFLSIFELEPDMVEQIRTSDEALLLLAFRWLQFGFVAGDALPIKPEIIKAKSAEREGRKTRQNEEKESL